jgi:hypothetical protein
MRHSFRCALPLALAIGLPFPVSAGTPYEEAFAQGKADALDPDSRAWYLQVLRPAFRPAFQPMLEKCLAEAPEAATRGFGLVFTVTSEGTVRQVLWRSENALSACIEPQLRRASFPKAPKDEFFFGLEVSQQP